MAAVFSAHVLFLSSHESLVVGRDVRAIFSRRACSRTHALGGSLVRAPIDRRPPSRRGSSLRNPAKPPGGWPPLWTRPVHESAPNLGSAGDGRPHLTAS